MAEVSNNLRMIARMKFHLVGTGPPSRTRPCFRHAEQLVCEIKSYSSRRRVKSPMTKVAKGQKSSLLRFSFAAFSAADNASTFALN